MTFKALALALSKREGLKQQTNIAQISELLRCLGDMFNDPKADRYAIISAIEGHAIERAADAALAKLELKRKPRRKGKEKK